MIPKILHIIWVGDEQRRPDQLIQTWVDHHPGWEIRLWGNEDLVGREWRCQAQVRHWGQRSCAAVADIMRWEILHAHGGICVAADSVCLRPLDDALLASDIFACWVHERQEPGQVSAAYVGCTPGNPLVARVIDDIAATPDNIAQDVSDSVGNGRFTQSWRSMGYAGLNVLPSCTFIPRHPQAPGQSVGWAPYACELWATRLGLVDVLHTLDPQEIVRRLSDTVAAPPPPTSINVLMMTVRTSDEMRAIVSSLVHTASRHPNVRITIADGSQDAEKARWLTELAETSGADVKLIFEPDVPARFRAGLSDDKAWTLLAADDDPVTTNYLASYIEKLPKLSPDVASLASSLYVGQIGSQLLLRQVEPCRQGTPAERLQAWQAQSAVQGVLYYSLVRTPILLDWYRYVESRPYAPSYTDQLLTALVATRGHIEVVDSASVLVRDESNWATAQSCLASDMRFYPRADMVLLHEAWWVADLIRLLRADRQPDIALALVPRVTTLLGNLWQVFSLRASQVAMSPDVDWRGIAQNLGELCKELSQPLEAGEIVRAFQAIIQWADATESSLLIARQPQAAPVGSAASEKLVANG